MEQQPISVVLCDYECHPRGKIDFNALSDRLLQDDIVQEIILLNEPLEKNLEKLTSLQGKKVIFAGGYTEDLAHKFSLEKTDFLLVDIKGAVFDLYDTPESIADNIFHQITSRAAILAAKEPLPVDTIKPNPKVLVYGSGLSGLSSALRLARENIHVDILKTPEDDGSLGYLSNLFYDPTILDQLREEAENHDNITFISDTPPSPLKGGIPGQVVVVDQGFILTTDNGNSQNLEYGTIVFAPERIEQPSGEARALNLTQFYVKLRSEERITGVIVFLLDYHEEMTSEVFKDVLHAALHLRKTPNAEVWVLSKHVQVALPEQEELYDQCREAGVIFVKYRDDLEVKNKNGDFALKGFDTQVGIEFTISNPDILIVPQKATLSSSALIFAQSLNIQILNGKYTQPDSLWRLPNETNRPGIFAVGSARGNLDLQAITDDVASGVLSVRKHLSCPDGIQIEEHIPVVDEEKCAYCLTCVRVCPFGAMGKDVEERVAKVILSACQACGICVAECPAEAIQMRNLKNESIYLGIKCLGV
jgi:Pyruvate/2-oxoacid:ferredoxin oxidoreductase delta subunit/thioredoxin reductase